MGSKLLQVAGILMIVLGAIAIFINLLAMVGATVLDVVGVPMGVVWLVLILSLCASVAELVAGILGVINWNRLDKANTCIVWGIGILALIVISNLITLVAYQDNFEVFNLLVGLVIPILYVKGAFQNKQASNQVQ